MELSEIRIRIKDPTRRGFQTALKYVVQEIKKDKKVHIATIMLVKPKDTRLYILRKPEQLNRNREFLNLKKEGRVKSVKIYELKGG